MGVVVGVFFVRRVLVLASHHRNCIEVNRRAVCLWGLWWALSSCGGCLFLRRSAGAGRGLIEGCCGYGGCGGRLPGGAVAGVWLGPTGGARGSLGGGCSLGGAG